MALQVALRPSALTDGNTRVPRVIGRQHIGYEKLLSFMATDTALEAADMATVMTRFVESLAFFLTEGNSVETPFGRFALGMSGTKVEGEPTTVEITNEGIHMLFRPNRALMARLREGTNVVTLDRPPLQVPIIDCVENHEVEGCLNEASAGQMARIAGSRLTIDKSDAKQGVFLVSTNGDHASYRAELYTRTGNKLVDFKVPIAPAGEYYLEVRTRPRGGDLRVGRSDEEFSIVD